MNAARKVIAQLSGWSTRRGQLRGLLLIAATIVIFALLFRRIDRAAVFAALRTIPLLTWIAALVLTASFPLFSALRWRLTLRALGHRIPLRRCLAIILGVSPISAIAPSKAGDLLKAISFRGEISILEVGGSVLVERALDVIVLAALTLVGGLVIRQLLFTRLAALVVGIILIGLLLLPLAVSSMPKPRLRERLERAVRALHALAAHPRLAAGVLFFTIVNWLASIAQTHLLLRAVGATAPFWLTTAVLPIAIFVGLVPVTIGGMGTRDAALVALLAPTASAPQALSVALLYSFFGYWLPAILGLPFLRSALFPSRTERRSE